MMTTKCRSGTGCRKSSDLDRELSDVLIAISVVSRRIADRLSAGDGKLNAMKKLSHCFICGHVHDELIIECGKEVSVDAICEQMGRTPPWIPGLLLRADGYECEFYKKD